MNAAFNSKTEDSPRTSPDVSLEARLEAAARVSAAHFERMLDYLSYLPASDIELVRQAWHYADKAHTNQWRSSGDPYITHPIAVTTICAHWKLDAPALMAALLHDAMEDCGITKQDLADRFGPVVADLVDGLTKLDKLHFNTREESQAESFRKMLLAMAKDVRVILIKLADRTHNMRTMGDMPRSKWGRIASETLEIYAPIAHRLGLNQTYRELQDLSFHYQNPWRYATLEKAITKSRARRHDLVLRVQNEIAAEFDRVNMSVRLAGRESTLYSLYQKMLRHHLTFAQVTDIYGFRIIVPTVTDCYTALGILHQMYKPVPGKFKDHIAIAKSNGYQSLHTMLVGPSGVNIEFQIRTEPMHIVAEAGIAAHWLYKSQGKQESLNTKWLQSLLDIQTETNDATEFWDNVKVDLFPDSIYVFTPKSKIMAMPRGATVVDFAYAIHSNIGHHTVSALINGEPASLRTELKSGDVVQIITDDNATPNPVWLGFVKTGRARSKIRNYLKTAAHSESMVLGETLLTQALREEGIAAIPANDEANQPLWNAVLLKANSPSREDLLTDIGMGRQAAGWVARHFMALLASQGQRPDAVLLSQERFASSSQRSRSTVALDGNSNASVRYAACCRPVPGDAVVAYLGRGDGLHVHNAQCINAKRLQATDSERLVPVEWAEDSSQKLYDSGLSVTIHNQKGVLARVATELSDANVDIRRLEMDDEAAMQTTELRFIVSVHNQQQVEAALRSLRRIPTVVRASRILPLE
ncbi:RelA/SpoT family protein [Comamonas jiangduensis]|jgi:guanosine-3',5'-bis(diphosphate) 3'-pyrophosphohydrolase|uniref:Bifunctional (P)ppGpp synthetase/guanosine-3',5'-bis(Diphosphate) 3'-pyrophosphohydrolase n=1 Tax=Comamonas jiangduensis TaxID=1194168 RepID=A0ABV4ICV1_9BURK